MYKVWHFTVLLCMCRYNRVCFTGCPLPVQEQLDVIGLNLSAFEPMPGSSDFLSADQLMNSTKAPEEYDPEELYDPADTL